jgi:hypothetical protein
LLKPIKECYHFYFFKNFCFGALLQCPNVTPLKHILAILCLFCFSNQYCYIVIWYFVWKTKYSLFTFCYIYHKYFTFSSMFRWLPSWMFNIHYYNIIKHMWLFCVHSIEWKTRKISFKRWHFPYFGFLCLFRRMDWVFNI